MYAGCYVYIYVHVCTHTHTHMYAYSLTRLLLYLSQNGVYWWLKLEFFRFFLKVAGPEDAVRIDKAGLFFLGMGNFLLVSLPNFWLPGGSSVAGSSG